MKINKIIKEAIANLDYKILTIEVEDLRIDTAIKDFLKTDEKDYKELFSYFLELIGLEIGHYYLKDYDPSTNSFKCYLNNQYVNITLEEEQLTISSLESQKTYKFVNEHNQNKAVLISSKYVNKDNNSICDYKSFNECQYYIVDVANNRLKISLKNKDNLEINQNLYSYLVNGDITLDIVALFNKLKEFLTPSDFLQIVITIEQKNSNEYQLVSLLTYQEGNIQIKDCNKNIVIADNGDWEYKSTEPNQAGYQETIDEINSIKK